MSAPAKTTRRAKSRMAALPRRSAPWIGALVKWTLLALAMLFATDVYHNPEKFRIKTVEVHGRFERSDAANVERAVIDALSGNYFLADITAVATRVEKLPWVFNASVRRKWPDTLLVGVTEVQPVARWGERQWLHVSGDLVVRLPGEHGFLPQLSGPDDSGRAVWGAYQKWSKIFASSGVVLDRVHLDERDLWRLQLSLNALARARHGAASSSVAVVLGADHADERISRFARALSHRLIGHFADMRNVDLRYPNGFAVGWRDGAPDNRLAGAINLNGVTEW